MTTNNAVLHNWHNCVRWVKPHNIISTLFPAPRTLLRKQSCSRFGGVSDNCLSPWNEYFRCCINIFTRQTSLLVFTTPLSLALALIFPLSPPLQSSLHSLLIQTTPLEPSCNYKEWHIIIKFVFFFWEREDCLSQVLKTVTWVSSVDVWQTA